MRYKRAQISILIVSLFIYAISAAKYKPYAKKYLAPWNIQKEVCGQLNKYNIFCDTESIELPEAIISQGHVSQDTEEQFSKSLQEALGDKIDYLENGKYDNTKYFLEKWRKKDNHYQNAPQSSSFTQVLPPSFKAKLPFEPNLYLSGSELVGVNCTSRIYDKQENGKRKNTSSIKIEQEMKMRFIGSFGERVDVNVDWDDPAKKRDISSVYKGQADEFIQGAEFGNIKLSSNTTEFTSYSKELFGLKADARYKNLGFNAFFGKTKGILETKHFIGNTQFEKKTIADTDYVKLKYYSLLPRGNTKTIQKGSLKVYIDHKKPSSKYNYSITSNTTLHCLKDTSSYAGNFVELVAVQDYIVDYDKGVLAFTNTLAKDSVVAINYKFADGEPLSSLPLIIKDINNTANITTEIRTFYNLGNFKITHDNARGNFILEIRDLNNTIPSTIEGGKNVPLYPPKEGYGANITVDFDNGTFRLQESLHESLYSQNDHKYNFRTEYQYTIKTLTLRPCIVPESEKIAVDGVTLSIGTDYILDYDTGILTIKDENIIKETTVLDVSYNYSLLGSEAESTLVGIGSRFDLTDNISFGASMLHNFTSNETVLPDIRNTPNNLTVGEGDVKITDLDIDALNMKINAQAKYALSSQNINTAGKAVIDSMDSIYREDLASMLKDEWFHSADGPLVTRRMLKDLDWKSYEMYVRDIDSDLEFVKGQKQLVLELNYDVRYRSQVAFAQKLCPGWEGQNYSKKLYIDVWVKDNNLSSHELWIDYASCINEDSDGCGVLDTEDTDGTGILSPWKDTGRKFHNIDGTIDLIGAHNGKLDTEDISGNGVLDTLEEVAGSYPISSPAATVIKTNTNGWKQIRIPIQTGNEHWKNIRILRIRVKQVGSGDCGKILIGKIAIVGNKWEKTGLNSTDLKISSIGRFDPQYKSLLTNKYYIDLCDIESSAKKDEQALKIEYKPISPNELALAKSVYSSEVCDISKYESIRFMVYAKPEHGYAAVGDVIIFRAGGNDTNYFECRIPVTNDSSWKDWKLITINQNCHDHSAAWSSSDASAEIFVEGNPSLDKISQFVVGVKSSDIGRQHQVWFNEIHVVGAKKVNGSAWKTGCDAQWNGTDLIGAVTIGVSKKANDRNFQTIDAETCNRDISQDSVYFNFEGLKTRGIKILPIKTGITKVKTITPSIFENKSNLVSLNDEGRVVTYTGYTQTDIDFGLDFPRLSAKYTRFIIDTPKIKRLEDKETFSGTMKYDNPLEFLLLPTSITADARLTDSYYKIYPPTPIAESNSFLGLDKIKDYLDIRKYHTLERSKWFALKMPFKFSQKILFSPAYAINTIREKNNDFSKEIEYNKVLNQTLGASLTLSLIKWFSPSFVCSINTKENYDINASANTATLLIPGQKKYIERNETGEVLWNLDVCDITSLSFLRSLGFLTHYKFQDSDSYDRVNKEFKSTGFAADKLWIRKNPLMDLKSSCSSDSYIVKTISTRDDAHFSAKYMPFEAFSFDGLLSPLNTVSVKCAYTESRENLWITGTSKNTRTKTWPDMLVGISAIEKFFGNIEWMKNTQLNLKYNKNNKEITTLDTSYANAITSGFDYRFQLIKKLDLYFAYEKMDSKDSDYKANTLSSGVEQKYVSQGAFDLDKWRFSLRYENEKRKDTYAYAKYTDNICKNSYLGKINLDFSRTKLPLLNKTISPNKSKIIFGLELKYADQKSEQIIEGNNNINYGVGLNATYKTPEHFSVLLGVNWDRLKYRFNPNLNCHNISLVGKVSMKF
jgi:hypothetical protein